MQQTELNINGGFCIQLDTRKKHDSFLLKEHFHKHHELYFLLSGETKYFINDEILYVHQGETAFIKNGYIHKTSYESDSNSRRILISFASEFIGEDYFGFINDLGKKKLFAKDETVFELFTRLYDEYVSKKPYYEKQCRNLLRELIISLLRVESRIPEKNLSENEKTIQNATKFISENLSDEITLHMLSEKYAMSDSHFSRTFKKYTGIGVSKYIKFTRLRHAEKLLSDGTYSITQIAVKCGFNNSNYFISEFKKHKGTTPLKYAFMNKEKETDL